MKAKMKQNQAGNRDETVTQAAWLTKKTPWQIYKGIQARKVRVRESGGIKLVNLADVAALPDTPRGRPRLIERN